jgi:Holliday junction resolvasome, endonuclease subunit
MTLTIKKKAPTKEMIITGPGTLSMGGKQIGEIDGMKVVVDGKLSPGDTLLVDGKNYDVGQHGKLTPKQMQPFIDQLMADAKKPPSIISQLAHKYAKEKEPFGQIAVMGIDVSTQTGVVVQAYDHGHNVWRIKHDAEIKLPPLPATASVTERMKRCSYLQMEIGGLLEKYNPRIVCIEAYSYGSKGAAVTTMVEFGMAARMAVTEWAEDAPKFYDPTVVKTPRLYEVAPSTLKKFVLGKGVGKKEQVMMQVFKRWGYESETNNIADAYVLAKIAAACTGVGPMALDKPQNEVLKTVKAKNA